MSAFLDQLAADAAMMTGSEFSEPVTFAEGDRAAVVQALFDLTYEEFDSSTGSVVVQTQKPRVIVWAPNVPWELAQGQRVTVRAVAYFIRTVERQGGAAVGGVDVGTVVVKLNKVV